MSWACNQCGACCRALTRGMLVHDLSHLAEPDGVCRHLDRDTNCCRIYETRPSACRVTPAHAPAALREGCRVLHLAVYRTEWDG